MWTATDEADDTSNSPQKKAALHAASELYRVALEEEVKSPPKPVGDKFGDRLAVDDDHDAPHPDALSDLDYGQPCQVTGAQGARRKAVSTAVPAGGAECSLVLG